MWNENCNAHLFTTVNLNMVQELINAITELGLHMVLPKDLPMLCAMALGNHIRPDNAFASDTLACAIVKCTMLLEEWPTRSNHFPIVIEVDMEPASHKESSWPNYKITDWEAFWKLLAS